MKTKRAAHFLLNPELSYSPPNEAIISALLSNGYEVDIYAPTGKIRINKYGEKVRSFSVAYGQRWLMKNAISSKWKRYNVFSGTSENPMAVVGVLSSIYRKPCFCLADEIRSGSYYGSTPEYWKKMCRWGMRRAQFNIVNDGSRIVLQQEYAGLQSTKNVFVYPGCFRTVPASSDRIVERKRWGISENQFVIGHSGWLNHVTGIDWVLEGVKENLDHSAVLQPMEMDQTLRYLVENFIASDRLFIESGRLGWRESWSSMASVDVGVIVYRNQGPQFQSMGTSSNKLCMFLAMGVPVIALRQDSFQFIEDYECGVLVDSFQEFLEALKIVRKHNVKMKKNALRCASEYINASGKYEELKEKIGAL